MNFAQRVSNRKGDSYIQVRLELMGDHHLSWWEQNIQKPLREDRIGKFGIRADRDWNWKVFYHQTRLPLGQRLNQDPRAYAVVLPDHSDNFGAPLIGAMILLVRDYRYLIDKRQKAAFLWYLSAAPSELLMPYFQNDQGQTPRNLGLVGLHTTVVESFHAGREGRTWLHADSKGGPNLIAFYKKCGMIRFDQWYRLPTLIRKILGFRSPHFYFDTPKATEFLTRLTHLTSSE